MPSMPKSFDFTRKNKINLVQSYLGKDSEKIRDISEIPTMIQQKMKNEMVEYENQVKILKKERI
jgi:hypothetical protein